MEFRTRQAVQLASAIEFYIEKFMSIMYLKNEGNNSSIADGDGGEMNINTDFDPTADDIEAEEGAASDGEVEGVSVDLLSLGDDANDVVTAKLATPGSAGLPVARTSVVDASVARTDNISGDNLFGTMPPEPPPPSMTR